MSNNYFSQQDLKQLFPFGDILDLEASGTQSLEAWFLGHNAENLAEFEGLILEAVRDQAFWRRNFYPGDPTQIDEQVKRQPEYIQTIDTLKESYRSLLAFLKKSVPFFSMRYQGHMNWEVTMPAMLGYFAAMLYNPNNVAFEASTATTILEMLVGDDICKMLGYTMPDWAEIERGALRPWGHLTCGGTVANIEAIWSARNLKFYPLALQAVLKNEPEFITAKYIEVPLVTGKSQMLIELDTWSLLNLKGDEILALPTRLQTEYQIEAEAVSQAIAKYSLQNLGIQEFSRRFLANVTHSPVLIVPGTKHYSFAKTTALLGIGSSNIIDVPVDKDARMDAQQLDLILQDCLAKKQPVYTVVAVMGSTEESAVDPLEEILALRSKYRELGLEFTVHGDAAWGGYFASLLREDEPGTVTINPPSKTSYAIAMSKYVTRQFEVLGQADSITVDPHKSGYIPYPAGALCYRNSAMRNLVTFAAPVVFHGGTEPSIGIYGIEGSKPGAAAAAVYLSHKVIRPTKSGYGKIHGHALFSCKKLYARLISMARPKDWFIVVPVPRLPAEINGGDIQKQLGFIRDRIDGKTNEELFADSEAMNFLAELGPDQNILTYAFNFRKPNGFLNTNLALANRLNKAIYDMLSINLGDDIYGYSLIVSTTDFTKADYGEEFIENYKQRLGVGGSPGDTITVLRSTVMNPWLTETAKGSFLNVIEQELRQVVAKALFRDSLLQIFEEFDVNQDGVLEIDEIKTKFQEWGYDDREIENFWKMSDINRDNSISVPEFLNSFSQFVVLSSRGKKS
ncbi:decarboxylase [Waterburya agarophytonicola K14]|uniref:Decarboxylase n=1 Tax=Waterburya agarophytonicola KI4 TaxID=2874699 RepID=A0A964BQZ5_9CYAN|nr:pyridoxal-dependent decarboxylase [Waterburya agarophytonicola]MCC0177187.1 decarboxylase [Waterburya agarophytonicola KI4]